VAFLKQYNRNIPSKRDVQKAQKELKLKQKAEEAEQTSAVGKLASKYDPGGDQQRVQKRATSMAKREADTNNEFALPTLNARVAEQRADNEVMRALIQSSRTQRSAVGNDVQNGDTVFVMERSFYGD